MVHRAVVLTVVSRICRKLWNGANRLKVPLDQSLYAQETTTYRVCWTPPLRRGEKVTSSARAQAIAGNAMQPKLQFIFCWHADLVFIQNGMLQPWLDARGLGNNTQVQQSHQQFACMHTPPISLTTHAVALHCTVFASENRSL